VHVADERMIDVTQVTPYLMETPTLGEREDERAAIDRRAREEPEARDRGDARSVLALRDRMVDRPLGGRSAANEREVLLLDGVLLEALRERGRRLARPREDERAARPAVE